MWSAHNSIRFTIAARMPAAASTSAAGVISQNRLAIIDLVTGDPPITNEDGSVAAVLNGEIYNFRELRDELRRAGHEFGSQGDTEVIAHLAEDHSAGRARPPARRHVRLRASGTSAGGGSCSAATASARSRSTTGTADGDARLRQRDQGACFADPRGAARLDPGAIPAYLTFGYVPTPRTFFEGVQSLPPGHVLTLEPGGEPRDRALLGAAAVGPRHRSHAPWTLETRPPARCARC